MELKSISKHFSGIDALSDVDLSVRPGEVTCLLGDNGAGKSTLIKVMSGVYQPTSGEILVDGRQVWFSSPRDAQDLGIATVHQDDGTFPLMSVSRNFFLGREPRKGTGLARRLDKRVMNELTLEQLYALGLRRVRSGDQLIGTLSGGERQAVAIARALYFGARLLILDEPTSALGVKEAAIVLRLVQAAKARGVGIIFITHSAHHALTIGDRFTVLIHGKVAAQFARDERSRQELINLMAGGEEMQSMEAELEQSNDLGFDPVSMPNH